MKKLSSTLLATALLFSLQSYGSANTTLNMSKTTILTDADATAFSEAFGDSFDGTDDFNFSCEDDQCVIHTKVSGFSGDMAKTLLKVKWRTKITFESTDHNFMLTCGKSNVYWCNVIQHNAVLR